MLVLLFALLTVCHANENILGSLTDAQLSDLRAKAMGRIELATRYDLARYGRPAETAPEVIEAARADFTAAVDAYQRAADVRYPYSEACSRYINNTKGLINALRSGYEKAINKVQDGKDALTLRARLEAIGFLLRNQIQLADQNAEGGQAPITTKGSTCTFADRSIWLDTAHDLRKSIAVFNATLWGEPGIARPFVVSGQLLRIMNDQERVKNRWAVLEFSAVGLALGFGSKRIFPIMRATLGSEATRYLQIVAGLAITSYGGYRGYQYMAQYRRKNSTTWSTWGDLQVSAEELLALSPENTQAFYLISHGMEKNMLRHNTNIVAELEPQVHMATERYGSLSAATAAAETKLAEIDAEIADRKKENK